MPWRDGRLAWTKTGDAREKFYGKIISSLNCEIDTRAPISHVDCGTASGALARTHISATNKL